MVSRCEIGMQTQKMIMDSSLVIVKIQASRRFVSSSSGDTQGTDGTQMLEHIQLDRYSVNAEEELNAGV